jgi:hypothetical protein
MTSAFASLQTFVIAAAISWHFFATKSELEK